jgi:hypothetical protein
LIASENQGNAYDIRLNGGGQGRSGLHLQVSGAASQEKLEDLGGKTPRGDPAPPPELASVYVQLAANGRGDKVTPRESGQCASWRANSNQSHVVDARLVANPTLEQKWPRKVAVGSQQRKRCRLDRNRVGQKEPTLASSRWTAGCSKED